MSERQLEIVRQPDGRFLASVDSVPAAEVSSWDDVRRLRSQRHLLDHWSSEDLRAFVAAHGHPFDDWWGELSPACSAALAADPDAPIPAEHHDEVKRTLRHQPRQAGLGLDGSWFTAEVRAYLRLKSAPASADETVEPSR